MGEKLLALTPKRRRFVEEYLKDLNATQAAIRAGYSRKTAREQGCQLLTKLNIREAVDELIAERSKRARKTADEVMEELENLAFLNVDDFMRVGADGDPFIDMSKATRAQKAGLIAFECHDYKDGRGEEARDVRKVSIRLNGAGKVTALVKLAEHHGLLRKDATPTIDITQYEQVLADEKAREDYMVEIVKRYGAKKLPPAK